MSPDRLYCASALLWRHREALEAHLCGAEKTLSDRCQARRSPIGAYTAVLGRVEAVVFTGGIGEHSIAVRRRVCAGLDGLGIAIDDQRNHSLHGDGPIHAEGGRVAVLVIPTNEELEIARQTVETIRRH